MLIRRNNTPSRNFLRAIYACERTGVETGQVPNVTGRRPANGAGRPATFPQNSVNFLSEVG